MTEQIADGALTDAELAKLLNVTVRCIQKLRKQGKAPTSMKIGRRRRTPMASFVSWGVERARAERGEAHVD